MQYCKVVRCFLTYLMKRNYSIAFFALILHGNLVAQDPLLDRARDFVDTNPNETIKIGELLLKKEQYEQHYHRINLLIAQSYYNKGNYDLALNYLFSISKKHTTSELTFNTLLLKADILRELHLHKQSDMYLEEARNLLRHTETEDKSLKQTEINKIIIRGLLDQQEVNKANDLWEQTDKNYDYSDDNFSQKWLIIKAGITERKKITDTVEYYYEKALLLGQNHPNTLNNLQALVGLSKVYFEREEYKRAIDTLLNSEKKANKLDNYFLLAGIEDQLSNNYLALKDQENQNKSYNDFLVFKTRSEKIESDAVNISYNLINQEYEDLYSLQTAEYLKYFRISLWGLAIIFLIGITYFYKNRSKINRFEEILKYLKASNNIPIKQPLLIKKQNNKKTNIPTETEQGLLTKLKRFEASGKFTNNDMSLASLASQFDTNTKYLSEVINKHYNDNFNMYINRLRVNYIIEKLKTDPNYLNYKISYLAEQSGFSSHSSFATVFKTITGIAPTTFIDLMQKENERKKQEEWSEQ